jgi:Na+/H+ antiporter NhaD/arsenite permease-like protein
MEFTASLAVIIFGIALLGIVLDIFDKAIVSLLGALAFVFFGIIEAETALLAVDFKTIFLLMGMMMLVEIARHSGIFSLMNVRAAEFTKGNPLLIMVLFLLITALFSAFLDNVTTILLVVPLTIALTRGMGLDPKPYVIAEIIFSSLGGALTLIGDPTNIIIGSSANLSFNEFIVNLFPPVSAAIFIIMGLLILVHWKFLKPIDSNLGKVFLSNLLIKKIQYTFLREDFKKSYVIKTILLVIFTLVAFALHDVTHIEPYLVALLGASLLLLFTTKYSSVHETLKGVEWPTLIYFSGLFVMVAGLKGVGVLDRLSDFFMVFSGDFFTLLLVLIWFCGIISMVLDNVPFVTIMVPVVANIQSQLFDLPDSGLLWWALALGVVFGGVGTMVGASTNVVGIAAARSSGIVIKFKDYFKIGFPSAIIALTLASIYFYFRLSA